MFTESITKQLKPDYSFVTEDDDPCCPPDEIELMWWDHGYKV